MEEVNIDSRRERETISKKEENKSKKHGTMNSVIGVVHLDCSEGDHTYLYKVWRGMIQREF